MQKKTGVLFVFCAALLCFITACSNKGTVSPGTSDQGNFVITAMHPYMTTEPPANDHELFKLIEKETGVKWDITWVPAGGYDEKVILTLASGDMPMVFNGKNQTRLPTMIDAQRAGLFWELPDSLLAEFPHVLSKLDKNSNKNLMVDGKLYGLIQERPIGREVIVYRKDWLDKLGLPVPKNIADLDKTARAFATQNPSGTGQETNGIIVGEPWIVPLMDWICIANGGAQNWDIQNGKFVPSWNTEPYYAALEQMRTWYKDKIINQDFMTRKAVQDLHDAFLAQRGGIIFPCSLDDSLKLNGIYTVAPEAEIDVQNVFTDNNGKEFVRAGSGNSGALFFPKSAVKTEGDLRRILKALDIMNDPQGDIFLGLVWGLKDRHYTLDGQGKITQSQEQKELRNNEIDNFVQLRTYFDHRAYDPAKMVVSPLQERVYEGWLYNGDKGVFDPSIPLISDTYIEVGNQLNNIKKDAVIRYIIGDIDMNEFKAQYQRWLNTGGTKLIEEYTAAYNM